MPEEEKEDTLASKIQELEEHLTFLDDHITKQDKEIMNLQKKLEKSITELKELREHFQSGALSSDRHDEKPPHY
ncbi:SlyX family protein [Opitutia bacterium ISCC 51]|nr:SlyX family protein [Opitutae bacterium ISCC 51]QXD29013.1 SlyX family protein [Opitutae bacterium ISCC 52]